MSITHTESKRPTADSSESNRRIYDFLRMHPVGVLSLVDMDNNPHASVVYFGVDDDFNLTFTTKRDTRKHDVLAHNDHVMLLAYEAVSQTTVQVIGVAEDISATPDAQEVFRSTLRASMRTSDAGTPPISKLFAGRYVAYRIRPLQIRMAVFARPDPGGYDIFESIEFPS